MSLLVKPFRRPGKPLAPVPANPARRDNYWLQEQVAEARADHDVNLLQPRQAYFHMQEVLRHRRRFVNAVGGLSGAALNVRVFIFMLLGAGGVAAAMWVNPLTPWWADIAVTLSLGISIWTERMISGAYREGFFKVYVVERRDFTDPSQATAIQTVWLPRLAFYYRPEIWRGSDGRSGYLDPHAVGILMVPEGMRIGDLMGVDDYWELPRDECVLDDTGAVAMRAWARDLQQNGAKYAALGLPEKRSLDDLWPWIAGGAELLIGLAIIVLAGGA